MFANLFKQFVIYFEFTASVCEHTQLVWEGRSQWRNMDTLGRGLHFKLKWNWNVYIKKSLKFKIKLKENALNVCLCLPNLNAPRVSDQSLFVILLIRLPLSIPSSPNARLRNIRFASKMSGALLCADSRLDPWRVTLSPAKERKKLIHCSYMLFTKGSDWNIKLKEYQSWTTKLHASTLCYVIQKLEN